MRHLGIVVGDIKTSYGLTRELKRMGVPFVMLREGEEAPPHVAATIVAGPRVGDGAQNRVLYDGNYKRTVLRAISATMGRERFREVIVGIDPGESAGIAVIADGELIEACTVVSSRLWREVEGILRDYDTESFTLKLGRGRVDQEAITRLKVAGVTVVRVEDVEKALPLAYRRKWMRKDAKSALKIALSSKLGMPR